MQKPYRPNVVRRRVLDIHALASRLRQVREERGLLATNVDEFADAGRGTMNRIEHAGRPELSVEILSRLARVLNVSLDYLVFGTAGGAATAGVDTPIAFFLGQVQKIKSLKEWIENDPNGAQLPLHVFARGLKVYREEPPPLRPDGVPEGGWAIFFATAGHLPITSPAAKKNGARVIRMKPRQRRT